MKRKIKIECLKGIFTNTSTGAFNRESRNTFLRSIIISGRGSKQYASQNSYFCRKLFAIFKFTVRAMRMLHINNENDDVHLFLSELFNSSIQY